MAQREKAGAYRLEVPLDASRVSDFKPDKPVKVLVRDLKGTMQSQTVQLTSQGKGAAAFTFSGDPGPLEVLVGPGDASDEELSRLQAVRASVTTRHWGVSREVTLPVIIPPYYWYIWLRWCREFTITGRVLCADGSPVPGAKVCAFDVDWWWWWSSLQQVGCDTTDATGSFEIKFRWCCGWWPWWWWRLRSWRLEPELAERIVPVLQRDPRIGPLPGPDPRPDLNIFERLLAEDGEATRIAVGEFDPTDLSALREQLVRRLPAAPELAQLRIWPWWPWEPWWDCNPDIIFKVTQDCRGSEVVIVDEPLWATRWNIPTTYNDTLIANQQACCIEDPPPPPGNCLVITQVCDDLVASIGGNPGAPALPAGFKNPGLVATGGDRPYAGVAPISGLFGNTASVDYYEFEWASAAAGPWSAMPPAAAGGFTRVFWGPALPAGPVGWNAVPFPFAPISGSNVAETREHFEAANDPLSWGATRFWAVNRDLLMQWLTENNFADGTYYLRLAGYDLVAGNLQNRRILPLCDTDQDNWLVLTLDNRPAPGPGSGHPPSAPDHPCGPGTVHVCTLEPDTDFVAIRINGVPAAACANVDARSGGTLEIDFFAHDPDGHLAYYTLMATYGENLAVNLLSAPGATLAPGPALPGLPPPALQVGPRYGNALVQGAVSPIWRGGMVRLHIPNIRDAFPETCCYQLELRAYKRTIVSCDESFQPHSNLSEYSFTVVI